MATKEKMTEGSEKIYQRSRNQRLEGRKGFRTEGDGNVRPGRR